LLSILLCLPLIAESSLEAPDAIVQNYCAASRVQEQSVKGASMDVEIEGNIPNLKKHGRLRALRRISALGRITYEALKFDGDNTVKREVIARYLSAEAESQKQSAGSLSVTPDHYRFKYKGQRELDGRPSYVFEVTPTKKASGYYKGELWIDAATYLRVQESGRLVKSPSILIKKVAFVRKYEIRNGISVPLQVQSVVDTRLVGKAELTIDFSNFSIETPKRDALGDSESQ
jgi:Outer membrane lipoprotein-sorting protein